MRIPCPLPSFNELAASLTVLGATEDDDPEEIRIAYAELRFERLKRERLRHEDSGSPQSSWPAALRGEILEEWEVMTREKMGLEVSDYLRAHAKQRRQDVDSGLAKYHVYNP